MKSNTIQASIRLVLVLAGAAAALATAACNTTRGAGQDVKELGQTVESSAEKHGAEH